MSDLIISAVPVTLVEFMFPRATHHLERVIAKAPNDINLETIKSDLLKGNKMLVVILDGDDVIAVNVLEKAVYDTGHAVLYIPITGGDRMDEWLERFMNFAHGVARDLKCDELRGMACRKGWLKALEKHDWYDIHQVIGCKVKSLEESE
ncbi:MAG: hypothetical protein KAU21_18655 [Gammaproteobacteria bacterium]|nr:hypothetical protein [Gammaproteobacteria bacterium]